MNLIQETNKLISKKSEVSSLTEKEAYKEIHSGIQTLLNNQEINQGEWHHVNEVETKVSLSSELSLLQGTSSDHNDQAVMIIKELFIPNRIYVLK